MGTHSFLIKTGYIDLMVALEANISAMKGKPKKSKPKLKKEA